jgi:hypothetical protein
MSSLFTLDVLKKQAGANAKMPLGVGSRADAQEQRQEQQESRGFHDSPLPFSADQSRSRQLAHLGAHLPRSENHTRPAVAIQG